MSTGKRVNVNGVMYPVVDSLGFVQSAGGYVKEVKTLTGTRMVIKMPKGTWKFWEAQNKLRILI